MNNFQSPGDTPQEHILVCLSPAPSNAKIIYTAAKMAQAFNGRFTALFVETPDFMSMKPDDKERLRQHIKLAGDLGASIETVYGSDVPYQIAAFARIADVNKIVLGRSAVRRRHIFGKPLLTERLIEIVPNLDIYIIPDYPIAKYNEPEYKTTHLSWRDTLLSLLILGLCTAIAWGFYRFGYRDANIITVYILGVLLISVTTSSRLYGIAASVLSVLIFNFCFTIPRYTFLAYGKSYPLTFAVMLLSSLITGGLAVRLKDHAEKAAVSAYRTKLVFDTNQLLQKAQGQEQIIASAAGQLRKLLKRRIIFYTVKDSSLGDGLLYSKTGAPKSVSPGDEAAEWALKNKHMSGAHTEFFPDDGFTYYPLRNVDRVLAVAGIEASKEPKAAFEDSIIQSVLGECALALENERNAREKQESEILAENERLRANLLRSISHDLRTPLTSISGNASNLIYNSESFDRQTRQQIYTDIYDDSMWLVNLVENLLAVTRIEDGKMELRLSTELLEDIINEAVKHIDRKISERKLILKLSEDIILVKVDARLMVQVIINLVDNAVKYTPPGSEICIETRREGDKAVLTVSDNGGGIPDDIKPRIFDMFYTGSSRLADSRRSLGMGLSLCKSIVNAHGGEISVEDNLPHGCVFRIILPTGEVELHE